MCDIHRVQRFFFFVRKTVALGVTNRLNEYLDRLCGLVVRVPVLQIQSYGFDYWRYQIF
jgi:hypothetical protein